MSQAREGSQRGRQQGHEEQGVFGGERKGKKGSGADKAKRAAREILKQPPFNPHNFRGRGPR